jgi:hypothetical protein
VPQATLLTDDLLRDLMAVGQVDIVVGIPTFNNVETIADVVRTADEGLAAYFPRERTVIMSVDGGSRDGTPETVRELVSGAARRPRQLRTRHQIDTSYRGVPGRASAIRLIFAAADLLQARAVCVLDAEVTSLTPAWIAALVGPSWRDAHDLVAPTFDRHPLDRPLLTQLVRPLLQATYGRRIQEPLLGEFGCSGRFAAHCLAQDEWSGAPARDSIDLWLVCTAFAGDFQACQTHLGPRTVAPAQVPRPGLRDVFPPVVGALFGCLDQHAVFWLPREGSEPLTIVGARNEGPVQAPSLDPAGLGDSFRHDVGVLRPILESILSAETFGALWAASEAENPNGARYPDDLWIPTVYDFLAAYHRGVMDRTHVTQALMPLYLARFTSFVSSHASASATEAEEELARLARGFETAKPYLIERWNRTT